MIRRVLVLLCVLTAGLAAGTAWAEGVVMRVSADPEQPWLGQRIRLRIEVLSPDGWAQVVGIGEVDIPGAYLLRTETQGTRLNENVHGVAHTGQRYEMALYCRRPGRIEIPPLPVTVVVKQWGMDAKEDRQEMTTPVLVLDCRVPPGAEGIDGLISTTRLEAEQTWSARPDTVAPGDAVTRSATLVADDVSGMAFPPMQHPDLAGVGIYPREPAVEDEIEKGAVRGRREEQVTYVFETPGEATIPDITLSWWNLGSGTLEQITLEGLTVVVAGDTVSAATTAATTEAGATGPALDGRTVAIVVVILALAVALGRRLVPRLQQWNHDRKESEGAYFRRIGPALRDRDPVRITATVLRWLDRLEPGDRPARLDDFLQQYGDDETRAAALALGQAVGTGGRFAEATTLGRGLRRARGRWHKDRRHHEQAAAGLPELNRPLG